MPGGPKKTIGKAAKAEKAKEIRSETQGGRREKNVPRKHPLRRLRQNRPGCGRGRSPGCRRRPKPKLPQSRSPGCRRGPEPEPEMSSMEMVPVDGPRGNVWKNGRPRQL